MANDYSLKEFEAQLVSTMAETSYREARDTPFRLALIGDWSGRANRGLFASSAELANWRPLLVDRDNLDQVMARLGVKLKIPVPGNRGEQASLDFKALDDFRPDRIFQQHDTFAELLNIRAALRNPRTYAEAAAQVREWTDDTTASPSSQPATAAATAAPQASANTDNPGLSGGSLLDQILSGGSDQAPPATAVTNLSPEIGALVTEAVKPFLYSDNEAELAQLIALVDARIAGDMNAILHHPDFQALESAWRALDFLVSRLETGSDLKLYLLDISFAEFAADLRSEKDFRAGALYKLFVEQTVETPGGIPWAAIAGNYTFDFASGDPGLVEQISLIATKAGAPFIAAATAHLLGCKSLFETPDPDDWRTPLDPQIEQWWETLRTKPSAGYVGFALPRFLIRLPYGEETEPTEAFNFEEMPARQLSATDRESEHESYLWANPAFAVAYLLAKGFSESGWEFRPGDVQELEGLPLHIREIDGETEIKPGAEVLLTLRAAQQIIDRGLMPLLTMKNSDTVRVGRVQSMAGTQLKGAWSEE
jgi:type VI secretion system protein ImpC